MRRGHSRGEAARRLGMDPRQAQRAWRALRSHLHQELSEHFAVLLAQLREVKAEAWDAWDGSKQDRVTLTTATVSDRSGVVRTRTVQVVETRLSDPKYLRLVLRCLDRECDLLQLWSQPQVA